MQGNSIVSQAGKGRGMARNTLLVSKSMADEEALKKRPPTPPRWKNNFPRKTSFE